MQNSHGDKLAELEKVVEVETEKIEEQEQKIKAHEKVIDQAERSVVKAVSEHPEHLFSDKVKSVRLVDYLRLLMVSRLTRHKLLFMIVFTIGAVLVWRGVWEITEHMPILSYSFVAFALGIFILWIIERYTDLH